MHNHLLPLLLMLVAGRLFSATVSGFVTREESGEPLQYVNVTVAGTKIGAQTNKQGYYVLTVNQTGSYKIEFSLVSHLRESKSLSIRGQNDDITLNARLKEASVELSKIVVTADAEASLEGPVIRASSIHRGREDIQAVVSTVEADVFRAVLTLPGVMPISDFFSGLYVRGGSPDQNLILLDDTDVYNPSHLGGLFSTFNTDAVENVELIKGGYPAKFGGRLSSVLDVTNRQGNRVESQGVARVSLISSSATLEGPWRIGATGGSYMASFRRTYLELVKAFYDELPDYYFYDGHAKLNWDVDNRNKLSFSGYIGRDDLSYDLGSVLDVDWGNSTVAARWLHLFSPRLFSNFMLAGSQFSSGLSQTSEEEDETIFSTDNSIKDLTAKGVLNWKYNNSHEVESGFEVKWNDTALKMETSYQVDPSGLPDTALASVTSSLFLQDTWVINPLWTLQPGLRLNWYRTARTMPAQIPAASYVNLEPRLSFKWTLDAGESVYANFGVYNQYLTLLAMDVNTPFDVWLPLDGSLRPARSLHYILGYQRRLGKHLALESEIYYKDYKNLAQLDSNAFFNWNNSTGNLASAMRVGIGHAYGAELLLRNDWNGLEGFVGYTFSRTRRKIEGLNLDPQTGAANYFYPRFDRSHSMSMVENYNISANTGWQPLGADFKLGLNFTYNSGQPVEVPERVYFDGENFQIIYSYKDGYRLPYYMRLDLSAKLQWNTRWGSIEPYLDMINVFDRKNVSFRSYQLVPQEYLTLQLETRDGSQFPFLPFIGVNITW
jgi:hypothetical protein